jgi:glycosyltransferase involved in cell wall biosynthesis
MTTLPESVVPRVSVIIPAFNAAVYLTAALESVQQQTVQAFEVVVVDDGSTDGTFQMATDFARRDPRVRVIRQENGGIGKARNAALTGARGEWIALLDSDDIWLPHYLEEQLEILRQRPDLDILSANAINLGGVWDGRPYKPTDGPVVDLSLLDLIRTEDSVCILSMFRRDILRDIGMFDEKMRGSEDYDFWLRAAAVGRRIAFNPTPLAMYRRRADSVSADEMRMLDAIVIPLHRIRAIREDDEAVSGAIDQQLARFSRRRLVVAARTALLEQDRAALRSHFAELHAATGKHRYRVAQWLSTSLPSALVWLYRCKEWWVRRIARYRRPSGQSPLPTGGPRQVETGKRMAMKQGFKGAP